MVWVEVWLAVHRYQRSRRTGWLLQSAGPSMVNPLLSKGQVPSPVIGVALPQSSVPF